MTCASVRRDARRRRNAIALPASFSLSSASTSARPVAAESCRLQLDHVSPRRSPRRRRSRCAPRQRARYHCCVSDAQPRLPTIGAARLHLLVVHAGLSSERQKAGKNQAMGFVDMPRLYSGHSMPLPCLSSAPHGLSSSVLHQPAVAGPGARARWYSRTRGDTYRLPAVRRAPKRCVADSRGLYNYPRSGRPRCSTRSSLTLPPASARRARAPAGHEWCPSGLDIACRALLEPGDEVIVLAPFWPLVRGIVSAAGALPVELRSQRAAQAASTFARAARALSPRTRGSTGTSTTQRLVLTADELTQIRSSSRRRAVA